MKTGNCGISLSIADVAAGITIAKEWLPSALFYVKNVVFRPAEAEYSYFLPILGRKYSCEYS